MLQVRKDVATSNESNVGEPVSLPTTSNVITVRTATPAEHRRAVVANALGVPGATVILAENSGVPESRNFYHRLALGGQLQHVISPLQVPGTSSAGSDSSLPANSRCTVTTPQDVAHIIMASTSNSSQTTLPQNTNINISASTPPQQLHAADSVTTVGQWTKSELSGQPTTSNVTQRIILNSGMSDVLTLHFTPTTGAAGMAPQQIMVLESTPGLVPSSDVTRVHSYSLPSAAATSLSSASGVQKMIVSTGQTLQASGVPHRAMVTTGNVQNHLRTAVKRPLVAASKADTASVNSTIVPALYQLSIANKLVSGLLPAEGKLAPSIPSSPKPKRMKLDKQTVVSKEILLKRKKMHDFVTRKINLLQIKYYTQQMVYFFLKNGGNMMDHLLWRKKMPSALIDHLRANPFGPDKELDMKLIVDIMSRSTLMLYPGMSAIQDQSPSKSDGSSSPSHSQSPGVRLASPSGSALQRLASSPVSAAQTTVTKSVRQPLVTHKLSAKHNSISSVYDSQIGSQEEIVERAKQEAYVMQRISDLRKEGLWSLRRLPKVQEAPRNKAHWDYLLEEMAWLATDFAQERKWKKAAAKKCARMITKYFQEKEIKARNAEKEEQTRLKKIASNLAKEIKSFWNNIEKLVEYKQQTWLEEKRKKVLDVHLNFIVDQTEKYSTWLTQGLNRSFKEESSGGSTPIQSGLSTPKGRRQSKFIGSEIDDEETVEKEISIMDYDQKDGMKVLHNSPPAEYLECSTSLDRDSDNSLDLSTIHNESLLSDSMQKMDDSDDDFQASGEEEDNEETIEADEKEENDVDHNEELKELEDENNMTVEEIYAKYEGAYASDFEIPELDDNESEDETMSEDGSDNSCDENAEVDIMTSDKNNKTTLSKADHQKKENKDDSPSEEINDIAATAESFQPKGNTLSTTQVFTKVPFLLKHQLREYQHIGLDWMNAMYDKKLNGILADEMGLGKTIQTISILAHLACEKGVWGPHLIVVPTSVMLNWEMEFKKWCPAFKILTYYGTPKERKQKRMGWTKSNTFHVCITSYKLVVQDHVSFRRKRWKYFILDEAQHIKNFKSQRWQMLLNFQSTHRLLLTGTPLQNNLMELWSLMHFLMPNVFQSHKEFKEWFVNPVTGMIEGNHEYNESLIKRLHKVLRPFLLRRLKCEVEKQLPKKYEHVVMCRLSKRQRYLYDDFMSQTKTKETLATGSFMSVINILMQLRKVCNHPNMFEERPTVSPFLMQGITFHTSSLVCNVLDYDPLKHISLSSLNLLLADLELSLTAFAAHRVMKFRTPVRVIEEIESLPEPPPPCPTTKMRINFCNSQGSGRSSPHPAQVRGIVPSPGVRIPATTPAPRVQSSPMVPFPQRYMVIPGQQAARSTSPIAAVSGHPVVSQSQTGEYTLQLLPQTAAGIQGTQLNPITGQAVTSTHQLTFQIQPQSQGLTRLSMPLNNLRLVHTAAGQHLVLSAVSNAITDSTSSISSPVGYVNSTANVQPVVLGANIATATVLPQVQKIGTPAVQPPFLASFTRAQSSPVTSPANQTAHSKPIGRVAPLNVHPPSSTAGTPNLNYVQASKVPVVHSLTKSQKPEPVPEKKNSLFYLEPLAQRQQKIKKDSLKCLAKVNMRRCVACPIYGNDLIESVTVINNLKHYDKGSLWGSAGYVNCLNTTNAANKSNLYFHHTKSLTEMVITPEKCILQLLDIINRFVFVIPAVTSPSIQLHVSHPCPSSFNAERSRKEKLTKYLSPHCALLHPTLRNMKTQFPELRLIEYDCGKLQRLALLLRELKTNHHRVLIFTQMTRMLDILEQFLNYHGHTYLRLDGNTKVEQRQALMERFNADKRIFCFILSTRSGGIGVNLTGADTVVFYDSDWNPTMDAQAQDRCHRIGQTRDVHIYRLISVKTIEENILKKANQKRLLGNLAIEGGNFTTAFFKKNSIHDLFGIEEQEEPPKNVAEAKKKADDSISSDASDALSQTQLEQALGMAEEESDLQAAKTARAEAIAELAEFDESIPLDNDTRDNEEKSPGEEELEKLMEQLTPVEKYAMQFLESMQEPVSLEQLKLAEEEIEAQKKDWELGHLKALKEEEERRSGLLSDEDPMLCYSRADAYNQVAKSNSSKKNRGKSERDSLGSSKPDSAPKRRSSRINVKKEQIDGDSEESNDFEIKKSAVKITYSNYKNRRQDHGVNDFSNVNGDLHAKPKSASAKSGNVDLNRSLPKVSSPVVKPFSNPNLVIRTRRASAIEAEEKFKSESESDISVSSPLNVNNATSRNNNELNDLSLPSTIASHEPLSKKIKAPTPCAKSSADDEEEHIEV